MIIAIDGVSASGKGTISKLLAKHYNLSHLETGLLYRYLAYLVIENGLKVTGKDDEIIEKLAKDLNINLLYTMDLSSEKIAGISSMIAQKSAVRKLLFDLQRNFALNPNGKSGAVLDGRDIGTVICKDIADFKFFINAKIEVRAERRFKQMKEKGFNITYGEVLNELTIRDERDKNINDLVYGEKDYHFIDTSAKPIEETFSEIKNIIDNNKV